MRPVRSHWVVFYYLAKNRGWSACPMKLYKICCHLPTSPSRSSWEGYFSGATSPPSSFDSLDFEHDVGAGGSLPHRHLREGCGALLRPCPVPPPQLDHPGLSDCSQDILAVMPAVWGCWSPACWPEAAGDLKQCMKVESCHILLLNPWQLRPVWFQVGRQTPRPCSWPLVLYKEPALFGCSVGS